MRPFADVSVLDVTECYGATSGGIRTYLHEKSRYIGTRPEYRQVLVVPGPSDRIESATGVRQYHLRGPRVPRHAPYRLLLSTSTVERIIRHERPDVIEVGSAFVVPWLIRQATQHVDIPLVYFHHTNVPGLVAGPNSRRRGRVGVLQSLAWRYQRRLKELFPTTIAPSQTAAHDLMMQGVDRVHVVPLGVDLELFTPARRINQTTIRQRAALPKSPLIGYFGRFAPEKDLFTVFDAWRHIEQKTGARLVLVGAGPLEAQLRRHSYADRVLFRPFERCRAHLADLYAAMDACIAPGPIETFGLAALEALASGIPVLAPDRGAGAEMIGRSGAGRQFVAGNMTSLIEEMNALLRDDLSMLGDRGRRYADEHHNWSRVFDQLFSIYRTLHRSRGPHP